MALSAPLGLNKNCYFEKISVEIIFQNAGTEKYTLSKFYAVQ